METVEQPPECPQFRYFDPLTGTVPRPHGPMFMEIADQARQILRRRNREEIHAAGCIIGDILNRREIGRLDLTTSRMMGLKDQTITAAKELRKIVGKSLVIDRHRFSKASRAEYFAVLALYLIGDYILLIRELATEMPNVDAHRLGNYELAMAGEYAASAMEAVTTAQLYRELAPTARSAARRAPKAAIRSRHREALQVKQNFLEWFVPRAQDFSTRAAAARSFLQILPLRERRALHTTRNGKQEFDDPMSDRQDLEDNEVRILVRYLHERLGSGRSRH